MTWDYVKKSTARDLGDSIASQIDAYDDLLKKSEIPVGETASHLQSTILFTSRKILEEIDGFPYIGPSYLEAVAGEIGFSRLIESKGYRISKVRGSSYELIGHLQWSKSGTTSFKYRSGWMVRELLRKLLPRTVREFLRKRAG
jgi:hypothetical protein